MSDWKPGDLALCVRGGRLTRTGGCYVASAVSQPDSVDSDGYKNLTGRQILRFVGLRHLEGQWADGERFRKIEPHTPDAEDAETIRLLNGQPVEARDA